MQLSTFIDLSELTGKNLEGQHVRWDDKVLFALDVIASCSCGKRYFIFSSPGNVFMSSMFSLRAFRETSKLPAVLVQ